ncbi:MAG: hypothetical protein J5695_07985 [Bacteroidales bacterium]|nr:hypothetical protein [Bacteroidales bacterium]
MIRINRITTIVLLLVLSPAIFAQGNTSPLYSMFSELELNRVPTGYLLDVAVERADLHKYNGTLTSDNFSDVAVLRNVLATVNSSSVNASGYTYDADSVTDSLADSTAVRLGAAVFSYNYIASDALTNNRIVYSGGRLCDKYIGGARRDLLDSPDKNKERYRYPSGGSLSCIHDGNDKFVADYFYERINNICHCCRKYLAVVFAFGARADGAVNNAGRIRASAHQVRRQSCSVGHVGCNALLPNQSQGHLNTSRGV